MHHGGGAHGVVLLGCARGRMRVSHSEHRHQAASARSWVNRTGITGGRSGRDQLVDGLDAGRRQRRERVRIPQRAEPHEARTGRAPARTTSAQTRAPNRSSNAPAATGFPLPAWPVRGSRPARNATRSRSTTAQVSMPAFLQHAGAAPAGPGTGPPEPSATALSHQCRPNSSVTGLSAYNVQAPLDVVC